MTDLDVLTMSFEGVSSEAAKGFQPEIDGDAPTWSKLAIVTFALSLISPLAAFHWVFWPIAFITIVFAFLAVGIASYGGRSVRGGGLACAAAVISLFSLALGVARFATEQHLMQSEARAAAEHWFNLIQEGKLEEAHQMTMGSEYREAPEIPLKEAYRLSTQLSSQRDSFFLTPPIKNLANDPQNCTVRFVRYGARSTDEKADAIQLRFSIRYREADIPRETTFSMGVARYREPRFEDHRWVMRGVTAVDTK